ncbi:hypothetical protein NMY22_g15874 [Coprinellus aureogranulatus]|nr:hypothetical protein NMY22_g15874 [Coprinellus aureogranulatus]
MFRELPGGIWGPSRDNGGIPSCQEAQRRSRRSKVMVEYSVNMRYVTLMAIFDSDSPLRAQILSLRATLSMAGIHREP